MIEMKLGKIMVNKYSKFAEYGTGGKGGTVDFQPNYNSYFQNFNCHMKQDKMPTCFTGKKTEFGT